MKKQLMVLAVTLSMSLATVLAEAKTFTWSASLDVLSMDPYSTNNSFTTSFVTRRFLWKRSNASASRRCRHCA